MNRLWTVPNFPSGLVYIPDWLAPAECDAVVDLIDSLPFDTSLSRRTQHYGARYDYDRSEVSERGSAPSIPDLLGSIGERLFTEGRFSAVPEQVIVNEYTSGQGIAHHVDRSSFGPEVATISLLETWPMEFHAPSGESLGVPLEVGSLAIMTGDSRYLWTHGIPKRKTDMIEGVRYTRTRRLSLTLRTLP